MYAIYRDITLKNYLPYRSYLKRPDVNKVNTGFIAVSVVKWQAGAGVENSCSNL